MATVHAQHAFAGKFHLETRYVDGQWEWYVLDAKQTTKTLYSGVSATLEGAKQNAAIRAALQTELVKWAPIGPEIEIPD